jgi:hypothetical protein
MLLNADHGVAVTVHCHLCSRHIGSARDPMAKAAHAHAEVVTPPSLSSGNSTMSPETAF